ncbi:DUF3221 domain-containing protein [Domibacillus aminovorans]|uniref:DUF3221 domain-containing protein n=1 Tax=Domibacillus aminovorans TaxID=29332 RepID=A0A177L163_9BACI|nr:DUF3221 domain-containing protein [Domibacillus aminovorans]OAH59176.1 hypothetical protein AWH49_18690 [Domibacillus aminovorans]
MKSRYPLVTFLLAAVLLSGCSENSVTEPREPSSNEYYVASVQGNKFLAVLTEPYSGFEPNTDKEYYSATYYEYPNASDLKAGQRVKIESSHPVMESLPGQGIADSVEVLPEYKPKEADMSESEIVMKAIEMTKEQSDEINPIIVGIKNIQYDDQSDMWKVSTNLDGEIFELKIEDK